MKTFAIEVHGVLAPDDKGSCAASVEALSKIGGELVKALPAGATVRVARLVIAGRDGDHAPTERIELDPAKIAEAEAKAKAEAESSEETKVATVPGPQQAAKVPEAVTSTATGPVPAESQAQAPGPAAA